MDFLAMIRVTLFGSKNKRGVSFDPARDIASLEGKVIFITGAAGDLGRQAAIELARHSPAHIYIADLPRDDNGEGPIELIRTEVPDARVSFIGVDLGSFASIKKAAAEFCAAENKLDILLLNAGVMSVKPGMTSDRYEKCFGINYLGHALLTKLLLLTLQRTAEAPDADVRVVVVASEGHVMAPRGGIVYEKVKTPCEKMSYFQRYGQSKVACIFLAKELARRYPQLKVVAVHPGRIATGIAVGLKNESFLVKLTTPLAPLLTTSIENGAKNHLWASTAAEAETGKYYEPVGIPDKESATAKDADLSKKLWEWTQNELKDYE
ncbi:NAD(P)-binding protein [Thozetella sp. PMI_491]|nr:NAD(P)-binding protein [Thozetella sp. PMI_491]